MSSTAPILNLYSPFVSQQGPSHPLYAHLGEVIAYGESRFGAIILAIAATKRAGLVAKMLNQLRQEVVSYII